MIGKTMIIRGITIEEREGALKTILQHCAESFEEADKFIVQHLTDIEKVAPGAFSEITTEIKHNFILELFKIDEYGSKNLNINIEAKYRMFVDAICSYNEIGKIVNQAENKEKH